MKVIGFDFFNPMIISDTLDGLNKSLMSAGLNRVDKNDLSIESVNSRLSKFRSEDYLLIEGDGIIKSKEYDIDNPGARIKMLYMDIDLGEPTYQIIKTLWKKVVKGGIIVFDEYGYHKWDEGQGVDRFLKEIPGEYEFIDTKICSPTAYIRKLIL